MAQLLIRYYPRSRQGTPGQDGYDGSSDTTLDHARQRNAQGGACPPNPIFSLLQHLFQYLNRPRPGKAVEIHPVKIDQVV